MSISSELLLAAKGQAKVAREMTKISNILTLTQQPLTIGEVDLKLHQNSTFRQLQQVSPFVRKLKILNQNPDQLTECVQRIYGSCQQQAWRGITIFYVGTSMALAYNADKLASMEFEVLAQNQLTDTLNAWLVQYGFVPQQNYFVTTEDSRKFKRALLPYKIHQEKLVFNRNKLTEFYYLQDGVLFYLKTLNGNTELHVYP